MNGLQFSVFLQDINIQQYGLTIFDVECILGKYAVISVLPFVYLETESEALMILI